MVVAGAGDEQAELGREGADPGAVGRAVLGVVGLDAVEPGLGEAGDGLLGHHVAALGGARMGEDGDAAGGLDQADRLEGVQLVLGGVRPAAVGQPLLGEGVGDRGDHAQLHQRLGEVGAPDRAVPGDPGDLLPGHVDAEGAELVDHGAGARHPVVADQFALAQQFRLVRVEEVGQHVHAHGAVGPGEAAGEFGARDEGEPLGERGRRLGVAAGGVVVGERDDVQALRGGGAYQRGGGVRAVRRRGVGVQVDAHDAVLQTWGRTVLRAARTGP
ncbi:hypothetical protein GA0115236_11606 [Streptomyces sp. IgraMP-1]|nr:hypothetical protein GA0115236_11606 [Streptomyces sp. IgraMP-1]